jgi:predicted N-acetyltransferase YhbS
LAALRPQIEVVRGREYLRLATRLLQHMRLADGSGGIWEAADVQWWSRQERSTDAAGQVFWLAGGDPVAAVVRTEFGPSVQCDVLIGPGADGDAVCAEALRRADRATEFPVRDDDTRLIAALTAAGYGADRSDGIVTSWLAAGERPAVPPLAAGFRLLSRAEAADRPHPMTARNGPAVADRLRGCSLYRPELDLMVQAPDGQVASYGLFWADPVTGVGLVEPMRTEDAFQRRGIASHLLAAGLAKLAQYGCQRLKVSSDLSLYLRAGFRPDSSAAATVYSRRG